MWWACAAYRKHFHTPAQLLPQPQAYEGQLPGSAQPHTPWLEHGKVVGQPAPGQAEGPRGHADHEAAIQRGVLVGRPVHGNARIL